MALRSAARADLNNRSILRPGRARSPQRMFGGGRWALPGSFGALGLSGLWIDEADQLGDIVGDNGGFAPFVASDHRAVAWWTVAWMAKGTDFRHVARHRRLIDNVTPGRVAAPATEAPRSPLSIAGPGSIPVARARAENRAKSRPILAMIAHADLSQIAQTDALASRVRVWGGVSRLALGRGWRGGERVRVTVGLNGQGSVPSNVEAGKLGGVAGCVNRR